MCNDYKIIHDIEMLVGIPFDYTLDQEGFCIALSLANKSMIYHGLIRHHDSAVKREIVKKISQLQYLKKLDLRRNRLGFADPLLAELDHLEYLDLGSNALDDIPAQYGRLRNLKYLNLGANNLQECPNIFSDISGLEILSLHKNKFRRLSPTMAELRKLQSLNLYGMPTAKLPDFIFTYTDLKNLVLFGIKDIPNEISLFNKLEYFTVTGSVKLKLIPASLCDIVLPLQLVIHMLRCFLFDVAILPL